MKKISRSDSGLTDRKKKRKHIVPCLSFFPWSIIFQVVWRQVDWQEQAHLWDVFGDPPCYISAPSFCSSVVTETGCVCHHLHPGHSPGTLLSWIIPFSCPVPSLLAASISFWFLLRKRVGGKEKNKEREIKKTRKRRGREGKEGRKWNKRRKTTTTTKQP